MYRSESRCACQPCRQDQGDCENMERLRILLADDRAVVRRRLRTLLEAQSNWIVVAEARNGKEAVEKERETKPDVALLDIIMPTLDGLGAARQIVEGGSQTKILILAMHESEVLIHEALEAGAWGCVLKTDGGRDLVTAIKALQHSRTLLRSGPGQTRLDHYLKKGKQANKSSSTSRLTPRQREIVLAEG
jgi:DNA-binding NarL/FixJ family response regulator